MAGRIDWEGRIGRRLKLRDLHVYFAVVQCGSMAKAATQLGVSQPTVSEIIADLEHTFGVRLLDRVARGVEPTIYGNALLKRGIAAFDELKQSARDIAFLADPTVGELKIGCAEFDRSGRTADNYRAVRPAISARRSACRRRALSGIGIVTRSQARSHHGAYGAPARR